MTWTPERIAAPKKQGVALVVAEGERLIARYDLEEGAYVQIVATADLPTDEALDWVEILITNKRRELERRMKRAPTAAPPEESE